MTTIEVFTTDGQIDLRDCDPDSWEESQDYAEELAYCGDVVKVRFVHAPKNIDQVFINGDFDDLGSGQFRHKAKSLIVDFNIVN
ncbi:hypothetical protein [Vibrio anguillarum]|uniref:hypothetical protein n=1 Tax=Vibrio anguillarum TaxID=55601 RepID=UPI001BE4A688|nr:hypothetical protein [Vibrio anguillarum]